MTIRSSSGTKQIFPAVGQLERRDGRGVEGLEEAKTTGDNELFCHSVCRAGGFSDAKIKAR